MDFPSLALVLDIRRHHAALHHTHRRREVAVSPEAFAPQVLFQAGELRPQYPTRAALERLHDLRHAQARLGLDQEVGGVGLDGKFLRLPAVDGAGLTDQCLQPGGDFAFEYTLAVLGNKDDVVAEPVRGSGAGAW